MNKAFFDACRASLFRGRLSQGQVDGLNRIVTYGIAHGYSRVHLAYILATAFHETAEWMQPIREGAQRFGPNYTDAQARRAVAAIYNKGIIRRNYALPINGKSYYGRGLVQITWIDNYVKFENILGVPLVSNPDLTLEWDNALPIMFVGMRDGVFTGRKLGDMDATLNDFINARAIVNSDTKKNGRRIAMQAQHFYTALGSVEFNTPATVTPKPPVCTCTCKCCIARGVHTV